jgi:hypothetical protein
MRQIQRFGFSLEKAEDIIQDVFLICYEKYKE